MSHEIIVDGPAFKFSSAHFVIGHEKCERLHGHNYTLRVEIRGDVDDQGFVVDFCAVKQALKKVIDALDHQTLIPGAHPGIAINPDAGANVNFRFDGTNGVEKVYSIPRSDARILPLKAITCELLAEYIHGKLQKEFAYHEVAVQVGETPSSLAKYLA